MASLTPPVCQFGWKAQDFELPSVDGSLWNLQKSMGKNGLLVMFICNHCPYVKSILPRLVNDTKELISYGINTIAISVNDVENYPEDSFDKMRDLSVEHNFSFPYCYDESQDIAKSFNAICTPDFFGFNRNFELQYRGRFDSTGRGELSENNERDLFKAMVMIAETQIGPENQISSIGCSIKWKESSTSA